jgi:uncharacterized protein
MDKLFKSLRPLTRLITTRPGLILLAGLLFAAWGGYNVTRLKIDSDFANLIPQDYTSVQALERLRATVGGESDAAVAIESPSFEANKRFAEALIPRALALTGEGRTEPYFTHVDYRKDVTFLQDNALYFATDEELDSLENYLDRKIEDAKLEANPFFFDLEEDLGTEPAPDSAAMALQLAYNRLVGKEYPISDDSTALVLRFYPSGSQTNVQFISDAYTDLQKLVDEMNPASYQADMQITLAGRLLRQLVEVEAITKDVKGSFGLGVLTVLLLVVSYFSYKSYRARAGNSFRGRILLSELGRMPVTALIIGVPLLASLGWTFGLAYAVIGSLNLMTTTLGLVLFGMGIDYGIHFYGRYAEEREHGKSVAESIELTFMSTGKAITVTAMTTSSAFFLLMIADFKGFSEFGFIAGTGILLALIAMTVLLPATIVLCEKLRLLNLTAQHDGEHLGQYALQRRSKPHAPVARIIVALTLVATALSIMSLPKVQFEYDFGKLDPAYAQYQALQDKVRLVYNDSGRRNPAYVIVDDPAEVPAVEAAVREYIAQDTLTPTISTVESLQSRYPSTETDAQAKLQRLASIREMLNDPMIAAQNDPDLQKLQRAASTTMPIALDEIPEFLKAPYTSKDGTIGQLVVIYPSVGLSDGKKSIEFSEDVGTITTADGKVYHAGSTSLVAADMLRLMRQEAPLMVLLTVVLIIILKFAVLRSPKWVFVALAPLMIGFLGMFGLMVLFGVKLNFYNLVVLPSVLGIGDDAGIHIVHRYQEEGPGSVWRVLRSTGEHITMSALTTMISFGGLILSFYPGLRSIGILAVIGIGMTLLTALVFLPALLHWLESRQATSENPVPQLSPVEAADMAA